MDYVHDQAAALVCLSQVELMKSDGLALFDFDGTITNRDSMFHFLINIVGIWPVALSFLRLSPLILFAYLGLANRSKAKLRLVNACLGKISLVQLASLEKRFDDEMVLDKIVRPEALDRIEWHKAQCHEVVVVSASCNLWLESWCARHGVSLICTQLSFEKAKFVYDGTNVNGAEKARLVLKQYPSLNFENTFCYGDSRGDMQMMSLGRYKYFKPFRG